MSEVCKNVVLNAEEGKYTQLFMYESFCDTEHILVHVCLMHKRRGGAEGPIQALPGLDRSNWGM